MEDHLKFWSLKYKKEANIERLLSSKWSFNSTRWNVELLPEGTPWKYHYKILFIQSNYYTWVVGGCESINRMLLKNICMIKTQCSFMTHVDSSHGTCLQKKRKLSDLLVWFPSRSVLASFLGLSILHFVIKIIVNYKISQHWLFLGYRKNLQCNPHN